MLPEAVKHLAEDIMMDCIDEGILVHAGTVWTWQALDRAIPKGPHTLVCTPKMTVFIGREMCQHVRDGFRIPPPLPGDGHG